MRLNALISGLLLSALAGSALAASPAPAQAGTTVYTGEMRQALKDLIQAAAVEQAPQAENLPSQPEQSKASLGTVVPIQESQKSEVAKEEKVVVPAKQVQVIEKDPIAKKIEELQKAEAPKAKPVETAKTPEKPKAPEQPKIHAIWESEVTVGYQWTQYTARALQSLGTHLLRTRPKDIKSYCPNFDNLDGETGRLTFWTNFIAAIAYQESTYRPQEFYKENFKDKHGNYVVSRGLLQLSKESVSYYDCDIDNEKQLHDPKINLTCGVRILDKWVPKSSYIGLELQDKSWIGAAAYWGVLRQPKKLAAIQQMTRSLKVCRASK